LSPDWVVQETASEARAVALDRLARYDREREERLAEYRATWERQWANERSREATTRRDCFYRVR
jgi:hypothetical protein